MDLSFSIADLHGYVWESLPSDDAGFDWLRVENRKKSKKIRRDFINLEADLADLYSKDHGINAWIPRLRVEMNDHLSLKNPHFQQMEMHGLILASDPETGRALGRIYVQIPSSYSNSFAQRVHRQEKIGHFGHVAAQTPDILRAIIEYGRQFLADRGCHIIQGPYSLSMNDEVGLLTKGHDLPPRLLMNYAPEWYQDVLQDTGFAPIKKLLAYDMLARQDIPVSAMRMAKRAADDGDISIRPMAMKDLADDLRIIADIFNAAWANNWGFIPLSDDDLSYMASAMRPILDAGLTRIAYYKGVPAAMIVALPNINEAIADCRGRLLPFGLMRILYRLKIKGLSSARVVFMGVMPSLQGSAIGSALSLYMIAQIHQEMRAKKMQAVELSWILEDNKPMRHMIEMLGGAVTREYTIYECDIT